MALTSGIIGLFVPLNAKFEMNAICRSALMAIETKGRLDAQDRDNLVSALSAKGFSNIIVSATSATRQGDIVSLNVQATYSYKQMTDIFTRGSSSQVMVYSKTSVCRRVTN